MLGSMTVEIVAFSAGLVVGSGGEHHLSLVAKTQLGLY